MIHEIKSGQRFGRLVVICLHKKRNTNTRHRHFRVECDCGKKAIVRADRLYLNQTKSCGCSYAWTAQKAIRRVTVAIQDEINLQNKYEIDYEHWRQFTQWLFEHAKELNTIKGLGGGNGEIGIIQACSI